MEDETNEFLFLFTNKTAEVQCIEQLMGENQNKNCKIIEEQFQTTEKKFHIPRDCTQTLYSNQKLTFNLDTIASVLNFVYAEVKIFQAALYVFKSNLWNSVPSMLDKGLKTFLMPRELLIDVLN